jgi:Spy/CpxP family protein refolding chaperone
LAIAVALALGISWVVAAKVLATPAKKAPTQSVAQCTEQVQGFEGLSQLNLTAAQQAKIMELKKEYAPKFKEVRQSRETVLTPAQKQARENVFSAAKAAKAAGKKPADMHKAVAAAVKLSPDQQAKMAKLNKTAMGLRAEVHQKILAILTPQQAAQWTKAGHNKCQPAKGSISL